MTRSYGKPLSEHLPCWGCTSSDAASIYQDKDNAERYYGICYSNGCTKEFTKAEAEEYIKENKGKIRPLEGNGTLVESLPSWSPSTITHATRGIAPSTLKLYEVDAVRECLRFRLYGMTKDAEGNSNVDLVALKTRSPNKTFKWTKTFHEAPRDAGFFGQTASFRPSKWLMITEGELDAMSAWQMLKRKMPVVSLKNGANDTRLNDFQKEYLDKFEVIYICFDADAAGQKAARRFSQSFPPSKIRIVQLEDGLKDANDYLTKGKIDEFNFAVSIAKSVVRQGLVLGRDTLKFLHEDPEEFFSYPYDGLNEMIYGASNAGELITILSGSGLGKSTVMKDLGLHFYKTTDLKLGCLFFEENKKKTVKILTGMHLGVNLALPDIFEATPTDQVDKAWGEVLDNDRWVLWDHWGSNTIESVLDTIRYMVANFGAKVILLDHISIVLSGGTHVDERKAIDQFMTGLRTLVNELEFICIAISHVTKSGGKDGTPHEEGGRVRLSHARGAGSIYQLSDTVLGLERDGQHDNRALRLVTTLRVLKSRLSGETGIATRLAYNKERGQLKELANEEYQALQSIPSEEEALVFLKGEY